MLSSNLGTSLKVPSPNTGLGGHNSALSTEENTRQGRGALPVQGWDGGRSASWPEPGLAATQNEARPCCQSSRPLHVAASAPTLRPTAPAPQGRRGEGWEGSGEGSSSSPPPHALCLCLCVMVTSASFREHRHADRNRPDARDTQRGTWRETEAREAMRDTGQAAPARSSGLTSEVGDVMMSEHGGRAWVLGQGEAATGTNARSTSCGQESRSVGPARRWHKAPKSS